MTSAGSCGKSNLTRADVCCIAVPARDTHSIIESVKGIPMNENDNIRSKKLPDIKKDEETRKFGPGFAPLQIVTSVCAALALGWVVLGLQSNQISAQQSNFAGGSPHSENADAISTLRLVFPAGVRSSWHTHSWGQLLMVESGRGLTQDRGGPLLEMHPGEPWWTPAGREHWHGAHPDEDVLQLTIYEGTVDWLEPVTDAAYRAAPRRP